MSETNRPFSPAVHNNPSKQHRSDEAMCTTHNVVILFLVGLLIELFKLPLIAFYHPISSHHPSEHTKSLPTSQPRKQHTNTIPKQTAPRTFPKMTFPHLILKTLLATALTHRATHAHMLMNTPTPFSPDQAATWPVSAPGSGERFPYPCQGLTDVAHRTLVTAGESTLVNFTGAAPHGGGSCQFGINYRGLPAYTADPEDWKTIYTVIGGCPAETAGNLEEAPYFRGIGARGIGDAVHCGDDKGVDCIRQFEVPIPKGLPNGDATFAWMWYNRITAEELYMMCAPVTVVGGVDDQGDGERFVEELPVMFLANVKGFGNCTTSTTGDQGVFNIPNPGRYGVQLMDPDPKAAGSCPVAPPARFERDGEDGAEGEDEVSSSSSPSSSSALPPTMCGQPTIESSSSIEGSSSIGDSSGRTRTTIVTVTQGFLTVTKTVDAPSPTTTEPQIPAGARPYPCIGDGSPVCIEDYWFGVCVDGVAYPTPLANMLICRDREIQMRPGQ